eukprot:s8002_g2.t1
MIVSSKAQALGDHLLQLVFPASASFAAMPDCTCMQLTMHLWASKVSNRKETTLPTWKAAYESWHQALRNVGAADVAAAALRQGRAAPMARWIRTWSRQVDA